MTFCECRVAKSEEYPQKRKSQEEQLRQGKPVIHVHAYPTMAARKVLIRSAAAGGALAGGSWGE
jgi:hypothetical protein